MSAEGTRVRFARILARVDEQIRRDPRESVTVRSLEGLRAIARASPSVDEARANERWSKKFHPSRKGSAMGERRG